MSTRFSTKKNSDVPQTFPEVGNGVFMDDYVFMKVIFQNKKKSLMIDSDGNLAMCRISKENGTYKVSKFSIQELKENKSIPFQVNVNDDTEFIRAKQKEEIKNEYEYQFQKINDVKENSVAHIRGLIVRRSVATTGHQEILLYDGEANMKVKLKPNVDIIGDTVEVLFVKRSTAKYRVFWLTEFTQVRQPRQNDPFFTKLVKPEVKEVEDIDGLEKGNNFKWRARITTLEERYTYESTPTPGSPYKVRRLANNLFEEVRSGKRYEECSKRFLLRGILCKKKQTINFVCFDEVVSQVLHLNAETATNEEIQSAIEEKLLLKEKLFTCRMDNDQNGNRQAVVENVQSRD